MIILRDPEIESSLWETASVERAHLRRAAIIKWIIVGTAICAAIAFGAT